MMIIGCLGLRIGVHQRGGQPRQRMQQVVLGVDRDPVSLDCAGTGIDDDFAFGAQVVPDPAQPDLADIEHSQTPCPDIAAHGRTRLEAGKAGQVVSHTGTAGWPPEALSTGK